MGFLTQQEKRNTLKWEMQEKDVHTQRIRFEKQSKVSLQTHKSSQMSGED